MIYKFDLADLKLQKYYKKLLHIIIEQQLLSKWILPKLMKKIKIIISISIFIFIFSLYNK